MSAAMTSDAIGTSRARRLLLRSGVPETAVSAAEAHGHTNWEPLVFTLDRIFMAGGGHLAQRRFWSTRVARLQGRSPAEVLVEPGGVDSVTYVAAHWLEDRLERRRTGVVFPLARRNGSPERTAD